MDKEAKLAEAVKCMKKADKYWSPSLLNMRLRPDWDAACPLYEKAALCFKQGGDLDKAVQAYERAAMAQEKLGSPYHSAKHMETCGDLCKQMSNSPGIAMFYKRAAELYREGGRCSTGADALARGARALEPLDVSLANDMYQEAIDYYEADGKEGQAGDIFRQAIALLIKSEKWADAVDLLLKLGTVSQTSSSVNTQCKSYLGAIVVWLYAANIKQAWQVFQDCLDISNFVSSQEAFAADALMLAYRMGSADAIQKVIEEKHVFKHLDNQLARLARKLPTGTLSSLSEQIDVLMGGGKAEDKNSDEEEVL